MSALKIVCFCGLIGGLVFLGWYFLTSCWGDIATGEEQKKFKKESKHAGTIGSILGVIGIVAFFLLCLIKNFVS